MTTVERPKPVAVDVASLSKTFNGKAALHDVSLIIDPGAFVVLLGPSGSGKTTLLRCVAGIERPSSGTIDIDGTRVAGPKTFVNPEKRGVAMVFQDYALWPHLTVRKNIAFPLTNSGSSKEVRRGRVDGLLERVGIGHLAESFPNDLSGGEQQRVALARALAADVGLILFDEPLSNLDADRREQLRIEIATLTRDAGATAIYITHDQSEAFALADKVGVLQHGSLVQFDTPETIYRRPTNDFVARFTGVAGDFALSGVRPSGDGHVDVTMSIAPDVTISAIDLGGTDDETRRLFVRAAGVSLRRSDDGAGLRGVVRDVAFTGRGYEHVVTLGEGAELTKVFSSGRFERDASVRVSLEPSACFVMNCTKEEKR
jgi:iron(III) transport system ATP-binding protein